jgi:two-component system, NtrC family, response regulator
MANVLIIDDNVLFCRTLSRKLKVATSHDVECVHTLEDGVKAVSIRDFDVVFLDVMMPDGNGLETLPSIKNSHSSPEVIIMTGKGESEGAAMAINNGAWDYTQKGASLETLMLPLYRALQYREETKSNPPTVSLKRECIIGNSSAISFCFDTVAQAASGNASILIEGETGVGKELFANAIHENSKRRSNKLVVLDCASAPEKLLESALFGHEKGAFTGAEKSRTGLIQEADGGTFFLDEVGELPLEFQKIFLRVLQERSFKPIGANKEVQSDFRVVAATNKDLALMTKKGLFRKDLLYRLNTILLKIPPLRERSEDIKDIAIFHIAKNCERLGLGNKGYSPEFMMALESYHWPGNVRQLIHTLERAVTLAGTHSNLFPNFLPLEMRIRLAQDSLPSIPISDTPENISYAENGLSSIKDLPSYKEYRQTGIERLEKKYLKILMELTNENIKEASLKSGISLSRLYKLIKNHSISK